MGAHGQTVEERMTDSFISHERDGVVWMTAPNIEARHAFSTRLGGVSTGALSSLNLGFGRGDSAETVLENYRRLGRAVGVDAFSAAFTQQVHGTDVRVITDADRCAPDFHAPCSSDGLVTAAEGLPLFCFTADCVPALLHDPAHGVIGAVHCGWRSSVGDILGVALEKMAVLGAVPGDIRAAFGPAIGQCCFETDIDVPDALRAWLGADAEECISPGRAPGKFQVDLRAANARRLVQLGVPRGNIAVSGECTVCSHDKYWSHRYVRGGARGSQCALITL